MVYNGIKYQLLELINWDGREGVNFLTATVIDVN